MDSPPPALHAPAEWDEAAEQLRRSAVRRVLVLGAVDMGKSTLCRFLMDASTDGIALLDTDVGQKTVGPPACVTLADRKGLSLAFVGTTNPVLGWKSLVEGTRRLAARADADRLIVNTSGLLAGPGRRLKAEKIQAVRPDLLIALGRNPALEAILTDHSDLPVLRLPPSPEARRKTEGEKRAARREAFGRYFAQGSVLCCPNVVICSPEPDACLPQGLLLGLADAPGQELGLGILMGQNGTLVEILTPVAHADIVRVTPGSLRLDGNFCEIRIKVAEQNPHEPARPAPEGSTP